jgi:hypothetical protein
MPDARHHVAHPPVIFVEVPVGGSQKTLREVKPGKYPAPRREHWRPARHPPSKAARTVKFLDATVKPDAMVRRFMEQARAR